MASPSGRSRLVLAVVAIFLTLLSCYLHFQNFEHAGALWRDEVNTIELASEAELSSTFANLQYDSFPLLWFIVLRGFMRVAGSADAALRAFGLVVGLLTIVAFWVNAQMFRHQVPLLTLFLIGINGAVIRYGDSLRGYGLGILTGTLMFGALWTMTRRMTVSSVALATICSLLAVHSLFYNAVFLFAVCMGGSAVMLLRRARNGLMAILGIGAVCAASLLTYVPTFRAAQVWNDLVRYNLGVSWFWSKWDDAVQMSGVSMRLVWSVAVVLGCAIAISALNRGSDERAKETALFCGTTLVVGIIAYIIFLKVLRYTTEPWYYLTLMVLMACCLDPLFGLLEGSRARIAHAILVMVVAILSLPAVLDATRSPLTNIDQLAAKITRESTAGDLVFVFPWQNGVSFQRYYRGEARWQTVPPLEFHRWHRYDLFKKIIADPKALDRFLTDVEPRLSAGGRVWIVAPTGLLENRNPKLFPAEKPRLPRGDHLWRMRLSVLLSERRHRTELYTTKTANRPDYEDLLLDVGSAEAAHPPNSEAEFR